MEEKTYKYDWPVIGNAHITGFLEKIIAKNEPQGAYIFSGPDNLGKTTTARYFARRLLCEKSNGSAGPCSACPSCLRFQSAEQGEDDNLGEAVIPHGDFHLLKKAKDKKNVSVEQVRELIRLLSLSSFLNSYKIGIIKHADTLSASAANALLKTLEEPNPRVIIILITNEIEAIPKTIFSRSQILYFKLAKFDEIYEFLLEKHKATRSEAKNFAHLCLGRPALAAKFFEDNNFRDKYLAKVELFIDFFYQDINERLSSLQEVVKEKDTTRETAAEVDRIFEIWQGIIRDLLISEFRSGEAIQHEVYRDKIIKLKNSLSLQKLAGLNFIINQAKINLAANVNPKLALEGAVISF